MHCSAHEPRTTPRVRGLHDFSASLWRGRGTTVLVLYRDQCVRESDPVRVPGEQATSSVTWAALRCSSCGISWWLA